MSTLRKQDRPTAQRILDAATPLFYRRGLAAVTLDEIAKSAKMTKRTLYYHFTDKDELIVAYLQRWSERTKASFASDTEGSGTDAALTAFKRLEQEVARAGFRGCPFVNAVAEINDRTHPAAMLAVAYKEERRAWFERLLSKDGIAAARKLSEQLMSLWEGAIVRALVSGNSRPVRDAREAASTLLAAARS